MYIYIRTHFMILLCRTVVFFLSYDFFSIIRLSSCRTTIRRVIQQLSRPLLLQSPLSVACDEDRQVVHTVEQRLSIIYIYIYIHMYIYIYAHVIMFSVIKIFTAAQIPHRYTNNMQRPQQTSGPFLFAANDGGGWFNWLLY